MWPIEMRGLPIEVRGWSGWALPLEELPKRSEGSGIGPAAATRSEAFRDGLVKSKKVV